LSHYANIKFTIFPETYLNSLSRKYSLTGLSGANLAFLYSKCIIIMLTFEVDGKRVIIPNTAFKILNKKESGGE